MILHEDVTEQKRAQEALRESEARFRSLFTAAPRGIVAVNREGTLDIPYGHHEKWNGTGYPRGLRGEAIPLAARIFAVVDVWDALSSDRPYRKAWPRQRVLDYIVEQAGKHFDPDIVKAFLSLQG